LLQDGIVNLQEQFGKAMLTAAHHENLKKTYQADYERLLKYRSESLVERLIPVLDAFQMVFSAKVSPEVEAYRVGFEYTYKMFLQTLENEGMSQIVTSVNQVYDPLVHQAMEVVETEDATLDQKIATPMLNGYKYKDHVLRPASVKIYKLKVVSAERPATPETQPN
jgi:molecular chaperone GrpE